MKSKLSLLLILTFSSISSLRSQTTARATLFNDSIYYMVENRGMLWFDSISGKSLYNYPLGTNKSPLFANFLWISAETATDTFIAFTAYGNTKEFASGPLDNNGNITATAKNNWNKI